MPKELVTEDKQQQDALQNWDWDFKDDDVIIGLSSLYVCHSLH